MVIAGIVAGGIGNRMGQNILLKQFLELSGKPIVIHTVEKFLASPDIDNVVVGVHKDWLHLMYELKEKYFQEEERIAIVEGGKNRNETIKNIVECAKKEYGADKSAIVVTHDAVRPFLSLRIIRDNVEAAGKYGVCDTVFGATDTIIQSEDQEFITDVPVRKTMYQGQTPQSFTINLFEEVYSSMSEKELEIVTDACKMFFLRGHKVYLVEGEVSNFKITYPFDLKMAATMMGEK